MVPVLVPVLLVSAHAHGAGTLLPPKSDCPSSQISRPSHSHAPIDSLLAAINSGTLDHVLKATNQIKALLYKGAALNVVYALWREDKAEFPNLRWDVATLPLVRIEFANILLQAWKNGAFSLAEGDRAEMHAFLRAVVANTDRDLFLLGNAISTLALLDDPHDVQLILEVTAKHRSSMLFRQAALALLTMCTDEAQQALKKLPTYATNQSDKDFLQRLHDDRARLREFWCPK